MSSTENKTDTQEEINNTQPESPSSGEELKDAIKNQVEFYFSSQNLPSDSFLLSKMDEEQYVPVSLIATFGKIKALTSDHDLIAQSLEESKFLELSADKSKLRLRENQRRNRVILHNLPPETTDQELKDLFSQGNFAPEIKADVNNCWFITFDSEEQATNGLEFIRQQKIHDKQIRARLKPEASFRSLVLPPNPSQFVPTQYGYGVPSYNYYNSVPVFWDANGDMYGGKDNYRRPGKKGHRKDSGRGGKGYDGKKRPQNRKKGRDHRKQNAVPLGPSDFPALPSVGNSKNTGYSKNFIKHTQSDLLAALKQLEVETPANFKDGEFPVLSSPFKDFESENATPIASADLPPRTTAVPLSERVKNSPKQHQNPQNQQKKEVKEQPKQAEKVKQSTQESKPKTAKKGQEASKNTWSQVAKSGKSKRKGARHPKGGEKAESKTEAKVEADKPQASK